MDHLHGLNEAQKQAVTTTEGPLLILAGAGSGKTRVIVHRIAELIKRGVAPERILAVTFTNKAAHEMRARARRMVATDLALSPYDVPKTEPFIGTFHALALHMIRAFHRDLGLPKRFTIYDREESGKAVRRALVEAGFDPKQLEPRRIIAVMSRQKSDDMSVEEFRNERASSYIDEAIAEVWERYERILKEENALDFDDILVAASRLLAKVPAARKHFKNAWDYVHVDEYQDTNRIQYGIIRALAEERRNIAVVGDVDQNIYSWRGASIEHIMNFERDFAGAAVIPLVENYRSTKTIIRAANDAIAKNARRQEKELFTQNADGEEITVGAFGDENGEAAFVAREAGSLVARGTPADEIAVLYRANFQSRALEEAFLREGVPYQVLGVRFFERREVKDTFAHLRASMNPESVADFTRAIQAPPRGIGKVTLAKVAMKREHELPDAARKKVADFRKSLAEIARVIETKKASDAVRATLAESGLARLYGRGGAEEAERLENLKELVTVASKYDALPPPEGIERLIEEAVLQSDQDELIEKKEGVKLMTVHAAKGLEFGTVFVTGLEEGLFPHERDDTDRVDDEEERRLFYVALTRAKRKAYLTYAVTRRIFGTRSVNAPSEFITELDPGLIEVLSAPNLYDEAPSIT
ncbi:MAG: UvrD-helicase domain-containing protein [Patescibacteria group bacterium]